MLRRAYTIGREDLQLVTSLTFPHYDNGKRGEYITEDQCVPICASFRAKEGGAGPAQSRRRR